MFDGRFRAPVEKVVRPIGNGLRRTGLTPDHLTVVGLLVSVAAAIVIGKGWLLAGLGLVILAALPDLFDGALARAGGHASQRGAFFDSVADRVADGLVFSGLTWYLMGTDHPYNAMLPVGILGLSMLISYQRAKAESLGLSAKGGLMERAERIILVCLGLLVSPLLVPILWVMLVLTAVTAVQRFVKVWRQAVAAPIVYERRDARRSRRVARRQAWQHRRTERREAWQHRRIELRRKRRTP